MSILDDLKIVAQNNNISIEGLYFEIKQEERKIRDKEIRKEVEQNKDMIGKCFVHTVKKPMFPEMKKFYKVLSNRSENEYRVECLTFFEHPTYWFEYKLHKIGMAGDYFCGEFEFDSFMTESKLAKDIRQHEEISIEEFNAAAKRFTEEMLELEWYPDHYRFGNKMPTDKGWEVKKQ